MKVLYWTDLFTPHIGGVESFSMDLIPALQARGHDVTVLTSDFNEGLPAVEQIGTIPVHRFQSWEALRTRNLKLQFSIRRAIGEFKQQLKPDVIHVHFGATSYFHLHTQAAVEVPTLTTVHSFPESSLQENSLFRKVVRGSQAINAVSVKGCERLKKAFPDCVDKFSFVYYALSPSEQCAIEVIPPSFDEPLILCLGRLTHQKGFDLALKAFTRVVKLTPRAHMIIAGEGVEEGPLKQLANELGVSGKVKFTGPVPMREVLGVMNKASIVLLPSRYEGLPLVALQAAQMQRPIISSDVDGLPELVINEESGLALSNCNERKLAKAIVYMTRYPQEAIRMGKAAAQRVHDVFGFDRCVSEYERLYERITFYG